MSNRFEGIFWKFDKFGNIYWQWLNKKTKYLKLIFFTIEKFCKKFKIYIGRLRKD